MDRPKSAPSRRISSESKPVFLNNPLGSGSGKAPRPPSAGAHGRKYQEVRSSSSGTEGGVATPSILQTTEVEHVLKPTVYSKCSSGPVISPRAATSTPTTGHRFFGSKTSRFGGGSSSTTPRPTSAGAHGRKVLICNAAARPSPSLGRQLEAACRNYPLVQVQPPLPLPPPQLAGELAAAPTPSGESTAGSTASNATPRPPIHIEGITGFTREKQEGLFKQVTTTLRDEHSAFASFVNCCDSALANLKVTMEGLPSPNSVDCTVSAMLLTKLSHLVDPSYGDFMRRLLDTVFSATFREYERGDIFSERCAAGEGLYNHTILVEDNQRLLNEVSCLTERLARMSETNARQGSMIEGVLTRFDKKHLERNFHVWRKYVKDSRIQDFQLEELDTRANEKLKKTNAFLRWQRFTQWSRDQRTSALSSHTHEQLQDRVRELQQRCNSRDEEIVKQRSAKERATNRASHLDEMMTNMRDENAKLTSKLHETEGLTTQLLGLAGEVLGKLDESLSFLGTSDVPATIRQLSNLSHSGATGAASTTTAAGPLARTMGRTMGTGGSADSCMKFAMSSRGGVAATHAGPSLDNDLVLPHVKADGSAWKSTVLSNVREVLLAWGNHVLSLAQTELQHQQAAQQQHLQTQAGLGGSCNPSALASSQNKKPAAHTNFSFGDAVDGLAPAQSTRHTAASGPSVLASTLLPVAMVNLKSDLVDGAFYLLVLSMLLGGNEAHSDFSGGMAAPITGLGGAGVCRCLTLLQGIGSDAERMALVVRMAKFMGLDGGLKAEDLLMVSGPGGDSGSGGAEGEPVILGFLSRLFNAYTTSTVLNAGVSSQSFADQALSSSAGGVGLASVSPTKSRRGTRIQLPVELTQGVAASDPRYIARGGFHFFSKRYFHLSEMMKRNQEWRSVSFATSAFTDRYLTKKLNGEVEDVSLVEFATISKSFLRSAAPVETLRFTNQVSDTLIAYQQQQQAKKEAESTTPNSEPTTPTARRSSLRGGPINLGQQAFSAEEVDELRKEQDDAADFIAEEMSSCLLSWARRLREGAYFYASCCGTLDDHNPRTVENNGWQKFLSDCRLVPRYASHKAADSIFKLYSTTPAAALAALVASGQSASQLRPMAKNAVTSKTNDVAFLDVQAAWCEAIVKLFYGKGPPSTTKSVVNRDGTVTIINTPQQWPNADETVASFKKFVEGAVIPNYPLLQAEGLVASFNLLPVQEVFKQYKDAVRKVYQEFAKEKSTVEGLRMRVEGFQLMVSKELKLLDAAEAQFLFATIRQSTRSTAGAGPPQQDHNTSAFQSPGNDSIALDATARSSGSPGVAAQRGSTLTLAGPTSPALQGSPLISTGTGNGINQMGFSMALVALSRLKYGNVLCPSSQALHLFLTTCLFPAYQHRLKLKF